MPSIGSEFDGLDGAGLDRAGLDRAGLDRAGLDRAGLDRAGLDRAGLDRASIDGASLDWRKAQLSVNNGACIELARANDMIAIRDSKDPAGPVLMYTATEWHAFLHGAKNGEFDDL